MFNAITHNIVKSLPVFEGNKASSNQVKIKFNTGQLLQDTVSFTSKVAKEQRIEYATKHQFQEKYGIKPEETTSTQVLAHREGLDPRTSTHSDIAAHKLGLDIEALNDKAKELGIEPERYKSKVVREEPWRRHEEIDAKLLGIKTDGVDLKQLSSEVKNKKSEIHRQIVEEVLAKEGISVPETYKPLPRGDFSGILKSDVTVAERLDVMSYVLENRREEINPISKIMLEDSDLVDSTKKAAERVREQTDEQPMTAERREKILEQDRYHDQLESIMTNLFRVRSLGMNEEVTTFQEARNLERQIKQLKDNSYRMKRANFDKALANLKPE
ncbi:MAG: hypothetical protein AB1782_06760 [Cyanobacteriota bacterium]